MSTKFAFFNTAKPDEHVIAPFNAHYGTGAPSALLGVDGDYYFRYDAVKEAIYKKYAGNWQEVTGGEINVLQSVGSGTSLVAGKAGVNLQTKSLVAGANILLSSNSTEVTISAPPPGEVNTASNLGSGAGTFASKSGVNLQFRSIVGGSNVTVTQNATEIVLSSVGGGDISNGANLGTGSQLFKAKVGNDLQFRTITAGTGISIAQNPNDLVINASGEANTASNLGSGGQVFSNKTGVDLSFRSIVVGANMTMTQTATEIILDALSGGGGEVNTAANVGTGTGELFRDKTGVQLNFKRLQAGSNITLTNNANEIIISASGGSGGISSLNGLSASTQTFNNDTNVTINSSGSAHTLGWSGQLSLARGGTGSNITASQGGIVYGTTSGMGITPAGTSGAILVSQATSAPVWKTLVAGTNVTIAEAAGSFTINASGGGGTTETASNLGSGSQVFKSKVVNDLQFRSIVAGSNITVTQNANDITIASTGGGGGSGHETKFISLALAGGGTALIKATGTTADLATITATPDYSVSATSRIILNKPTSVTYGYIRVDLTAAVTTGRTAIRIEMPDPLGATTLDACMRPLGVRLNPTSSPSYGIASTTSTMYITGSTIVCETVGHTAGGAQAMTMHL